MRQLSVRESRLEIKEDASPGFEPIGRECDDCEYRELYTAPSSSRCEHRKTQRVYKRQGRPSLAYKPFAYRCRDCKRMMTEPAPRA